jgi:hypothetical protein
MKNFKIYIHHYFTDILFLKLAHNSTNRIYNIEDKVGNVTFEYSNNAFEFVFDPVLNDNEDGIHLMDFFASVLEIRDGNNPTLQNVSFNILNKSKEKYGEFIYSEDVPVLEKLNELISEKKNWIFTFLRTEKIFTVHEKQQVYGEYRIEDYMKPLEKQKIITDNLFLNDNVKNLYPNFYFAFTNTVFQWNEIIGIRWYYEFKKVFDKLTFDYDLCFSVRNHKYYRTDLLNDLSRLDNPRILLQRTDSLINDEYDRANELVPHIKLNSSIGESDFSNLTTIPWHKGINLDLFFRLLPTAKMQILDESWAWSPNDYNSQYLSEKTFGLLLSGIPFISTHSYPLEMIEKMLGVRPHPFIGETRKYNGDTKATASFVGRFMSNFDENHKLCKDWSDECLHIMISKVENENNLLDMISDNSLFDNKKRPVI